MVVATNQAVRDLIGTAVSAPRTGTFTGPTAARMVGYARLRDAAGWTG
ncbi:MAG: hypothetical protein IPH51_19535 [Rubrivivax sp.]|nr:hypothetical protein [Rubrivivax sp.]